MGENKIKWLTEDRVESLILCDIVCLRGYQMQFTCRFKSLSRAPRYSTHAFHVYFPTCITWWPMQTTLQPLQKKIHAFIFTPFFFSFPHGFEVLCEKGGGEKKKKNCCLLCLPFPLSGIKPHFEGECCHASHNRRSRGNKQGQIHQTEGVALQDGGGRWVLIKVEQLNSF